jgi:hypothetical protein
MSDYAATFASVPLKVLLEAMERPGKHSKAKVSELRSGGGQLQRNTQKQDSNEDGSQNHAPVGVFGNTVCIKIVVHALFDLCVEADASGESDLLHVVFLTISKKNLSESFPVSF